jgi:hypothetical protein
MKCSDSIMNSKLLCLLLFVMASQMIKLSSFTSLHPKGASLQRHNTVNSKHIFPEKELLGLSPNFVIHVSVSDLCT